MPGSEIGPKTIFQLAFIGDIRIMDDTVPHRIFCQEQLMVLVELLEETQLEMNSNCQMVDGRKR